MTARQDLLLAADAYYTAQWGSVEERAGIAAATTAFDTAVTAWVTADETFSKTQLLIEAHNYTLRHPTARLGQALVAVANTLWSEFAVQVAESDSPFYSDSNIDAYLTALQTLVDAP